MNNNTIPVTKSQGKQKENFTADAQKKVAKLQIKKADNKAVIDWLIGQRMQKEIETAYKIYQCATYVKFSDDNGQAKITDANFCRQRVCHVCAWRRQAKFLSQITPILAQTSAEGYEFIFVTLTVKNATYKRLKCTIDNMMSAYNKLLGRSKIHKAFAGVIRSMEITYNPERGDYHPHIHMLVAVKPEYFFNPDLYITKDEMLSIWSSCAKLNYLPSIDMEKVTNSTKASIETIKYALKPSIYEEALKGFYYLLRGRRLISFSGIFSKYRKDFEREQEGDLLETTACILHNTIAYRFDSSGGLYRFLDTYTKESNNYEEFLRIRRRVETSAEKLVNNTESNSGLVGSPQVYI